MCRRSPPDQKITSRSISGDWRWVQSLVNKLSILYGEGKVAILDQRLGDCSCGREEHKGGVVIELTAVMPPDMEGDKKMISLIFRAIKAEARLSRSHRLVHTNMTPTTAELYFERKKGR